MLLLMIIVLSFKSANCIECFDCVSVSSISDCHQTKVCPWDHYCFTYKIVFGDHTKFSLGCRSTQDCLSSLTATSDDLECSQCCAADSCNANLCANGKHVVNTSVCEDDPDYNCQSTVDVCSDINHAERVCRKFCGICKIVHGQWSMWSSWGSCSVTCGIGLQIRDRSCSNPLPGPGGDQCNGDTQEDRLCFLGHCADGAWSSWSAWSTCSASCLGGISERTRLCNHPAPSPLGHGCYGNDNDIKTCNAIECPVVNGEWSTWKQWGSCSVTCDIGTKKRTRTCTNPTPSTFGKVCIGNSEENDICNSQSCQDIGTVRLVDGAHLYEGRLEVFYNGTWGTVCDDMFDQKSASVVCNMLSFPRTVPTVYPKAHFGTGTLPILLDDVKCNGTETSLFSCPHSPWGSHDCNHIEDVGIVCITAVDGQWSSWTSWGTCSVTCSVGMKSRTRTCNNPSRSGSGQTCIGNSDDKDVCNTQSCPFVDGHWSSWTNWGICPVNCGVGTKTRTRTCTNPTPSGFGKACSGNSEDKYVCNSQSCSSDVRLVDGAYVYEGRLEVYHNGVWGTVCDDYFNETSATVDCNMLHYRGNTPRVYSGAHFGPGTLPILLDDVVCIGTETSLFSCQHKELGSHNCGHSEDVGISCIPNLNVRLVGGSNSHRGRVEVSVDGSNWGTVCDDYFSDNSAKVVCRMLGYSTSNARMDTTVSEGSGHIYLDNVICTGTEGSLTYCKHRDWGKHNCQHSEDVGVVCG